MDNAEWPDFSSKIYTELQSILALAVKTIDYYRMAWRKLQSYGIVWGELHRITSFTGENYNYRMAWL